MKEEFADELDQDAHDKFQRWRQQNDSGYFLNLAPKQIIWWHRAACPQFESPYVSREQAKVSWTAARKICSTNKAELETELQSRKDAEVKRCKVCNP